MGRPTSGSRAARSFVVAVLAATLGLSALAVPLAASAAPAKAASTGVHRHTGLAFLQAKSTPATGRVPARELATARTSAVTAKIVVSYSGFSAPARSAFQKAVDLWSKLVASSQPIKINAKFDALPEGALGGAGEADSVRDWPGTPRSSTWYPIALANALAGQDLSPTLPDIEAEFSNDSSLWYFGTDGQTPAGKYDFTTVVLHELGHGLGFGGYMETNGSLGRYGFGTGYPEIYDRFTQTAGGQYLVSLPNTSTALGSALRSGNIGWGGAQGKGAYGGFAPRMWAPGTWAQGTSYVHLDDDIYGIGNVNSLMTPYLDDGESIYDPGDIVLGIFRDMGWKTAGAKGVAGAPTITSGNVGNNRANLYWTAPIDTGRQRITGYRIHRYPNGSPNWDQSIDTGSTGLSTGISGLVNGTTYRFTVLALNASGASAESAKSEALKPVDTAPLGNSDAFVRQQFADFAGRQPDAGELKFWRTSLNNGTVTPASLVVAVEGLPAVDGSISATVRLYSSYFLRLPDAGGLGYWAGRVQHGSTLSSVSSSFAASSEFKTRYGSLSNTAFVKLVYTNVLGRQPDSGGLNYWVGQLNAKKKTRGQVMLGFSESSENKRETLSTVSTVTTYFGMLRRMPTGPELSSSVSALDGGGSLATLVNAILDSVAYANRF